MMRTEMVAKRGRQEKRTTEDWARNQKSTASMSAIAEANLGKFNYTQQDDVKGVQNNTPSDG